MPSVGTTHHLKLGNEFLIVRPNSYQKKAAPTFGARFSSGNTDYTNLSLWQHWVQKCWIGGMGADDWTDDAMFADALGVDTTVHEKVTIGRTLKRGTGLNWTVGGPTNQAFYRFITFNGVLYCLGATAIGTQSRMYSYTVATQAWAAVTMPASFVARSITVFNGNMYIGGTITGTPKLYYASAPGTWTLVANPAGVTTSIYAMRNFNGRLYVAFGTLVWRLKTDFTWDGNVVFYTATASSGSNYIQAMENHLGFLYMLSQNGHLHRTDGNNTFDIWSWDGQTTGQSLRSYDGKLFVGTYEYTDTVDVGAGVLYQFTGSAVTELKRWGKIDKSTTIGQMAVYNRRLYYGASGLFGLTGGFGIAAYDVVEDAHSIWAVQTDTVTYPDASGISKDWLVDDVIVFGGKAFAAVRGWGVFFTEDSFNDVALGLANYTTSTGGGVLNSSMYDAGTPGLQKLWQKVTVYADLPVAGTKLTFAYSIDGGTTYVSTTEQVGPSAAGGQFVFFLNNVRSTRFKWRITLKTTDVTKTPTLRAIVVAYLPQPEPNWMWSFTIPISDKWTLLDGTVEVKSTNALIDYLEGLFRSQTQITFIDIDGIQWASNGPGTMVFDMSTVHYDIGSPREGDIRITLLETVETY